MADHFNFADEMKKLKELLNTGSITKEEYEKKKFELTEKQRTHFVYTGPAGKPKKNYNFASFAVIIVIAFISFSLVYLLKEYVLLGILVSVLLTLLIDANKKLKIVKQEKMQADEMLNEIADAEAYTKTKRDEADKILSSSRSQNTSLKTEIERLSNERSALLDDIKALELSVTLGMVSIDGYENLKSDEVKNQLALLRVHQDNLIKDGNALIVSNVNTPKRIIESQKKQILRCFNAECVNIIGSVTVKNVDSSRSKIQRSYDVLNKIFLVDGVQITREFLSTKFDELSLVYAYMVKEEEEREQRKAIKEQVAEEEKVRREIEREKQKIAKEEMQFNNEVNKLMAYMRKSSDEVERQLYADKITDLQEKLKELEKDKENVLDREQNTRAGFVYIISNIGSFGENVFKIGMTRRLEPMERISELSSASVPFPFDVHAMIFSEDAPGLETTLHQYFDEKRVNRMNPRKEFFRVDLDEIKQVVLENHNSTVKFVDIPDAMEYRETLKLTEVHV